VKKFKRASKGKRAATTEDVEDNPPTRPLPKAKTASYQPTWTKKDLKEVEGKAKFPWKIPSPKLKTHLSPVSLFELIFTPELMDLICKESNDFAALKGHENFDLDVPTLKLFLSILLLSGSTASPNVLGSQRRCSQYDGIWSNVSQPV
jgi:hypothetical protein